jgi:hypothetical protein
VRGSGFRVSGLEGHRVPCSGFRVSVAVSGVGGQVTVQPVVVTLAQGSLTPHATPVAITWSGVSGIEIPGFGYSGFQVSGILYD